MCMLHKSVIGNEVKQSVAMCRNTILTKTTLIQI